MVQKTNSVEAITKQEDIIGQSDFASPVYGWYPTQSWVPNELIREDHTLSIQAGRTPQTIIVGMYHRDAEGVLQQLGTIKLRQQNEGEWVQD